MPVTARQNAIQAGIAAALMLFFGWAMSSKGISGSGFYNATVDVFFWSLRIGGILLAIAAGLCAADLRVGLLFDSIVSGLCGALMALIAVYWLIDAGGIDLQYVLYVVFGGGFVSASMSAMRSYRAVGGESSPRGSWRAMEDALGVPRPAGTPDTPRANPATTVHPASVRPEALPNDGEPAPPEGYLAALAKEKDEPPTASFE